MNNFNELKRKIEVLRGNGLHHARIGKDGETVRCAATFTVAPDGSKRYQCGEFLGVRYIQKDAPVGSYPTKDGDEIVIFDDIYGFRLPANFGHEKDGDFYRVTQRPHYRTEGCYSPDYSRYRHQPQESLFGTPDYSGYPVARDGKPRKIRTVRIIRKKVVKRENSYWGEAGEFVLPISVLCPRCGRLNLISESLLDNSRDETGTE